MAELLGLSRIIFKMESRNKAFIVPSFMFPIIMLTLMSVAGRDEGSRGDISYASFLTPGILCMAYAAIALVALPVMLASYREKGMLRNFKTAELPMRTVIVAILLVQLVFMLLQTVVLILFAYIALQARFNFTDTSWLCLPVVIVGLFSLLSVGFLISARLSTSRAATMTGNLTNLVAIFLGGVFFPVEVWPEFVRPLTWVNPLTWIIEALRKSVLYGTMDASAFAFEMGAIVVIGLVSLLVGLRLFRYE